MTVTKEGKVAIAASNGRYCVTKGFDDTDVTVTEDVEECVLSSGEGDVEKTLSDLAINLTPEAQACLSKGTTCAVTDAGIMFTLKVSAEDETKTENFYVIADDGNKLTLIMDRNLGDNVEWYAGEDNNSKGPTTVVAALKLRTDKEWSNIPVREYMISDDSGGKLYESFTMTMRVRMITLTEVNNIITANNNTMPTWLHKYLYNTGDDRTSGYWTSTASGADYSRVYYVNYYGGIGFDSTNHTCYGLRPVIELSK